MSARLACHISVQSARCAALEDDDPCDVAPNPARRRHQLPHGRPATQQIPRRLPRQQTPRRFATQQTPKRYTMQPTKAMSSASAHC